MFDFLKKKFQKQVQTIAKKVTTTTLEAQDIDTFFAEIEHDLLQSNVALEVIEHIKASLKEQLKQQDIKRGATEKVIQKAFKDALLQVFDAEPLDLKKRIEERKKEGKPLLITFLGCNGTGKTTSMAKLAFWLQKEGYSVVFAAADTFRAASIEQLEHHGKKLNIPVIKHQYKADPAAVVFDAVQHADTKNSDVVLADTAGRMHVNKNLIDELKKIIRVNNPDIKVLVIDSLTGNDAIEQAKAYAEAVGVDALILTKVDANEQGGAILSSSFVIHRPILFLGVGQGYEDMKPFDKEAFIEQLLN